MVIGGDFNNRVTLEDLHTSLEGPLIVQGKKYEEITYQLGEAVGSPDQTYLVIPETDIEDNISKWGSTKSIFENTWNVDH